MIKKEFQYNVNKNTIEQNGKFVAYVNSIDGVRIANKLNILQNENKQLKKELKRCKDWINSDKNDYELTLAFIKNKGYSLKDVLEYEKELKMNDRKTI